MSCQTNPLQNFVSTTSKQVGSSYVPHLNNLQHTPSTSSQNREQAFLDQGGSSSFQPNINNSNNLGQYSQPLSIIPDDTESWLPQLNSMQINDPLEFNNEYKKFYSNYEKQTGVNSSSLSDYNQTFVPSTYVSHNNNNNNSSTSTNLHMPKPKLVHSTQSFHLHQSQRQMQSPVSLPPHIENTKELDSYFDLEFKTVEDELNKTINDQVMNDNDEEQLEFQRLASGIVESCTPVRTPGTPGTPVGNKLSSSKFIGLMKRISDGVVTMKENKTELFSPENGEIVGNEYFPIQDKTVNN